MRVDWVFTVFLKLGCIRHQLSLQRKKQVIKIFQCRPHLAQIIIVLHVLLLGSLSALHSLLVLLFSIKVILM
jgi:hypothetical protein